MPSMGASFAATSFNDALRNGKEISWEEIVRLDNIIGGEILSKEDEHCFQGIISGITLKDGVVSIMCPWVLQTPTDEDGDPVGTYIKDEWEVMKDPKLPLTIHVPKSPFSNGEQTMIHTGFGSYASGNWAVRYSEDIIVFWAGGATI